MGFLRDIDWRVTLSGLIVVVTMIAGYIVTSDKSKPVEEVDYQSKLPMEKVIIEKQGGGLYVPILEIASKPVDIQVGLMYRKEMAKDHGMMFLMWQEPRVVSFWMKNTYIPLDMLFISREGKIVHIHKNAQPLSEDHIPSTVPVMGVIELNAGRVDAAGLRVGDRVMYNYFQQPAYRSHLDESP